MHNNGYFSLRARDGFTLPKGLTTSVCKSDNMHQKKNGQLDVTGGITSGTKLKMPIFTLFLPHNLQSRILVFQKFM